MRKTFCIVLCLITMVFVQSPGLVIAQVNPEITVIPQQIDPNKLPSLQQTYFAQLEEYRNQEQKYLVAKNQYHQLNTLASQEVAVAETRQLLSLRANVFLTYIEILDELLNQGKGIPLENKNPERVFLSLLTDKVQIHKSAVESAQNRFAIDQESINFAPTYKLLESHTYYILSLIKLGDMQVAYDKLLIARDVVKSYVQDQTLSTAVRAEKDRGFDEIERNIKVMDKTFTPIKTKVYSSSENKNLSAYSQLSSELSPVYAQINQVIQFLEEVRK
ncbi:MAG: hypothetical protein ABI425_01355 [Patescibacteria group bacterium]